MDLFGLDLSIQQWEAILTATGKADCKMKILNMNSINLTTVNPKLLASAVNRIGTVRLCETQLTGEQWEAIFTAIRDGNSKMKELYIPENNFTTVSPSLLASAVNMLEEVNMSGDTELTLEQVEAILTQSLVKTSLRSLEIGSVEGPDGLLMDLEDLGLDEEFVARARFAIGKLV